MKEKIYTGKRKVVIKQGSISTIEPAKGTTFTGRSIEVDGQRKITTYEIDKVLRMTIERESGAAWRIIYAIVDEFYYNS